MTFVVDASVVFAWQFPDESTEQVESIAERLVTVGAVVPVHWCAEIGNGFALAVRRGRMSSSYRTTALKKLFDLQIETDTESAEAFFLRTQDYCDRHGLTAYDAAYLELASRRKLPLATLDKALYKAAEAEKIPLLGRVTS
ncbi:MAG TPA: type II toxin-antitoxin system VapC family toxin [Rhizobiaceae bacterium]|nr:type II toxin-antitoxin system VapC family toxin [Rhizobiaceae bacterium]